LISGVFGDGGDGGGVGISGAFGVAGDTGLGFFCCAQPTAITLTAKAAMESLCKFMSTSCTFEKGFVTSTFASR
jgi:hypothetical protein